METAKIHCKFSQKKDSQPLLLLDQNQAKDTKIMTIHLIFGMLTIFFLFTFHSHCF